MAVGVVSEFECRHVGLETASDVQLEELAGDTMKGTGRVLIFCSTVGSLPGPGSASQNA